MNEKFALALLTLSIFLPLQASAQVTGFSIVKPNGAPGAVLTLPGAQRRIALRCTSGCSTTGVATWSIAATTGGASATLTPSASGNYVDVTLGSTAGSCPVTPSGAAYSITPTASVTLQATSQDDPTVSDTIGVDVCSPPVEAYTIPFYRVLYSGQREDVQGVIWGASNTTGVWQIISQPTGGDAILDDTTNSDTVFQATVAGLYKISWTSSADSTKIAFSTFYVTGNTQPRLSQPNGTEPIDCTVDPNTTGSVFEVGPSQQYPNLEAIAPSQMVAGITIRLHNEDTTGLNPTTYHEWIQIGGRGTHDNPIRLCGVPDAAGNLPIMDGANATGRSDILSPNYVSGAAAIYVYNKNYDAYPGFTGPQFIIVEGISVRNYSPTQAYYPAGTSSGPTAIYAVNSSGFRFQTCHDCEFNGSESSYNGNGVFAEANDTSAWGAISQRLLFEGNNVHDNGVTGDNHEHNWYLQAWFQVVQFNQIPTYNTKAQGSQYKDRGMSWFRYNYVGTGAARMLDFVEDQDAAHYMDPNLYLTSTRLGVPKDQYTGDELAAAQEAWHHSEFVYGNIIAEATSGSVHFSADSWGGVTMRTGTLDFYNNTFNAVAQNVWRFSWFDTGDHGSNFQHVDWPTINVDNVAAGGWNDHSVPFFSWNSQRDAFLNFGEVLLPTAWGTNVQNCVTNTAGICDGTGWPYASNTDMYFDGNAFNVTGVGNFVSTGSTTPWDPFTYQLTTPVSGLPLTGTQAVLPVRFQYVPTLGYVAPRTTVVTSSTGGVIGATDPVAAVNGSTLTAQAIIFSAIPDHIATDAPFSLSATASSGLPIIYTIISGPASISGNIVTLTGASGTVVIRATQPGDSTYAAAPPIGQTFRVALTALTAQTITFPAIPDHVVGDAPFVISATASSGLTVSFIVLSGPATESDKKVTLTGTPGTVVIQAIQQGDLNYAAAPAVSQSFNVTSTSSPLTAQTITFPAIPNHVVGDAPFSVTATASSGLPVSYAVVSGPATVSGNTVTLTGTAGTVIIQALQAGDSTYAAAPAVSQSFTVTATSLIPQTITFPAIPNQIVGILPFLLNATASSGLPVSYTVVSGPATLIGGTVTLTGLAGTVVIQATQPGNSVYAAAPPVTQSFGISLAPAQSQTITFPAIAAHTFGNAAFTLSATASSGLPVAYAVTSGPATVSGSTVTLTGVGTVTIQATQAGNSTYAAATAVSQSFAVSQASQTITFPVIAGHAVGNPAFSLSATASSGLPVTFTVTSGPATISGSTVTLTGTAGTVVIKASQAGNTNYAAATAVSQSFVVSPGAQTITFPAIPNKSVGNPAFTLSATASSGLAVTYTVTSGPATVSGSTVTLTGTAGTVVIKASQAGNANYTAATAVSQSFTVSTGPTAQTITFPAIAATTIGSPAFTLSATASSGLVVTYTVVSGPATVSGNTVTLTGTIGTVVIKASQAGNASYAAATAVSQSFTVAKGPQTITFPAIPNHITSDADFALNATASSGLPVSFVIVSGPAYLSGGLVNLSGAGGRVVVQATQAGNASYAAAPAVSQGFNVSLPTNMPQTITFPVIANKTVGNPAFTLGATATSGLKILYTVLSGPATVSGTTVSLTGSAGTVVIQASQLGNANYAVAPAVSRSFTVAKASQTITFPAIATHKVGNPPFTLTATASSGLAVTYAVVSGPAKVSGSTVTLTGTTGTVVIKASQAGNAGYNAATAVSQSFLVQ